MTADFVFQMASSLALLGWILLIFISPVWWSFDKFITGVIITMLSFVYAWMIVSSFNPADMAKFGTLNGVMDLFTNKEMVTAGWVHYLAFDLFIGTWMKKNATRHNISHFIMIPVLCLTFILGPIGLLLYFVVRLIFTRQYFPVNFEQE